MSQFNEIQDQEPASSVAVRIKNAFDYLFSAVANAGQSLWEELSGNRITPKNNKSVYTPNLEVGNVFEAGSAHPEITLSPQSVVLSASTDLLLNKLKPQSGYKLLLIDSAGKILSDEVSSHVGASQWMQVGASSLLQPKEPFTGIQTNLFLNSGESFGLLILDGDNQISSQSGVKWNNQYNTLQLPFASTPQDVLRPVMVDKDGIIRIKTDLFSISFSFHDGGPNYALSGFVIVESLTWGSNIFLEFENELMPEFTLPNLLSDAYTIQINAKRTGTNTWHPPKIVYAEIEGDDLDLGIIVLDPIPGINRSSSIITGNARSISTERNIICRPTDLQESESVVIDLPEAGSVADEDIVVRKEFSSQNALVLKTQGQQEIIFNDAKAREITASEMGSWLVLVSDGISFNVVMDKGDWQLDIQTS